jgi:negative regulator of flagellin synthesis FlgM
MKVSSGTPLSPVVAPVEPVRKPAPAGTASTNAAPLQSAALESALAALDGMPEIDQARVAELREQLERGHLPFNAGKLAALITAWHRGAK